MEESVDGENPFDCATCDKSFKTRDCLKAHMTVHSDGRPHSCGTCDKKFKTRGDMLKHERIHTGEKRFVCKECDKSFTFSAGLKTHQRQIFFGTFLLFANITANFEISGRFSGFVTLTPLTFPLNYTYLIEVYDVTVLCSLKRINRVVYSTETIIMFTSAVVTHRI